MGQKPNAIMLHSYYQNHCNYKMTSQLFNSKQLGFLRLRNSFLRKPQILKGVYETGFNRPSKIQENVLPMMLAEPPQNLIAAFVLAVLSHVDPSLKMGSVCVSPTNAVAQQTGKVIEQMGVLPGGQTGVCCRFKIWSHFHFTTVCNVADSASSPWQRIQAYMNVLLKIL